MATNPIRLNVNGVPRPLQCADERLLVQTLRDDLQLTGTHVGCDTAQCGACTVLIDGAAVKSCNVFTRQVVNHDIRTIESLGSSGELHSLQQAFSRHHALQCGYCTPGMLMRALAMRAEGIPAEPGAVRQALAGNLCRCTGYAGIVAAICDWLSQPSAD